MSIAADERAAGAGGIGDRDRQFVDLIARRAGGDGWAIAIVGKRHAANEDGSMCRLLEGRGHICEVTTL
jgi:hypothetical protein